MIRRYIAHLRRELAAEVQIQRWQWTTTDPRALSFVAGVAVGRRRARRFWRRVAAAVGLR